VLLREPGPIGEQLVQMCGAMRHRGIDSTGFALYGEAVPGRLIARLRLTDATGWQERLDAVVASVRSIGGDLLAEPGIDGAPDATDRFVRLELAFDGAARPLVRALEAPGGVEIQSVGSSLEIVKDVGDAETVDGRHGISAFRGTHGLGHVRLATESITAVPYGHPFWAEPFPDVAIVHNGQLTNYYRSRRILEQEGYRFRTGNDSELIAVYLADKLSQGFTLHEALQSSIDDMDGTFSFLVSTKDEIGYAKDHLAAKPMVMYEDDEIVAIASEEVSLNRLFPGRSLKTVEPAPGTFRTWNRASAREQAAAA
jgi:glutamate synthase domain-containing protein 1